MTRQFVLGGTYTTRHPYGSRVGRAVRTLLTPGPPAARGIHTLRLDGESGAVTLVDTTPCGPNPTSLAAHPLLDTFYTVNETASGSVTAFAVSSGTGRLEQLNVRRTDGAAPCHLSIDGKGRWLYAANYASGTVVQIAIESNGQLGERVGLVRHTGKSIHPRQRGPHPHAVRLTPDHRFAFVPDLGTDRIVAYTVDDDSGGLVINYDACVSLPPGSGPRSLVFHPQQQVAFAVAELSSNVMVFRYDSQSGTLELREVQSTLPEKWRGTSTAADIHIHPDGRLLYVSNRGHDSIASFGIQQDGRLIPLAITPTSGRTPRGFAIDPTGRFLLAAHQDSDDLVSFAIHPDGRLAEVARSSVPTCVCLTFVGR